MPFARSGQRVRPISGQTRCLHCGTPVEGSASAAARFCCSGCEAVYGLLVEGGLTRYYDLSRGEVLPASEASRERSHAWLEPLLEQAAAGASPVCSISLDIQGLHCAACVWLMNELFRRREGGANLTVNPALGKVRLAWKRGAFDVAGYLREVEQFGYLFGPSRKLSRRSSRDLVVRMGVCIAATMNVMLFSFSFYFGLDAREAAFGLFTRLSVALATLVVAVGGWPFLKSAWLGLRRGVLHLDLPIALGILLVWAMSLVQALQGRGGHTYLDTLCTFVTLMVVGRWLQQRVLDRNRQFLLEDDGATGLLVRRRAGARIEVVPAPRVHAQDALLVAPGDLLPVDAQLTTGGTFSLDWITGEPQPRAFAAGATVPAGAFNAGRTAVEARATQAFAESALPALLSATARAGAPTGQTRFFDLLSRGYAAAVLALATLGFALWLHEGSARAIDVAAALLVVTCPCAIGIAIPLAHELVQARLRRRGLLVRSADLLDRLAHVRTVVFDKTGTLTLGRLELEDAPSLRALDPLARDVAYELATRSNHPVSRCLAAALAAAGARSEAGALVEELPGKGLEWLRAGCAWRLGAPGWAAGTGALDSHEAGVTVLSADGDEQARFVTRESVRSGSERAVRALGAAGCEVWLLSGDEPARVAAFAARLGIPAAQALGGQSPEQKAQVIGRLGGDRTLFIGDGVNDSLAFAAALCAGTPAIDRPVMPGKADFFLLGEDLGALRDLFVAAHDLRAAVRRILGIAFAYNALAVSVCLLGLMTPLAAAVAMPASSVSILLYAAAVLGGSRSGATVPAPSLQEAVA